MENNTAVLTKLQQEIMQKFYSFPPQKVVFNKKERKELWSLATAKSVAINLEYIKQHCPALHHRIMRSYKEGRNIQSAVFSECVYAQTLANMLGLDVFSNCFDNADFLPDSVKSLLRVHHIVPRYVYSTIDQSRILVQAGGCNGIDCVLINVVDLSVYTIEFKEPGAKSSEPDLPKYGEDGILRITQEFLSKNPQFEMMLKEQEGLNFFENMGRNINNFSPESVNRAVSNTYIDGNKKSANVICTEDVNGCLTMIPVNQVVRWANIEGEIRTAGRNNYKVWTPNALIKFLSMLDAQIEGSQVTIEKHKLRVRRQRGGNRKMSGYKINPLFFVYAENCFDDGVYITFNINDVRQINPTITGKMFFKGLKHFSVKRYYGF